jgi:Family of unknown function (DUF6152)
MKLIFPAFLSLATLMVAAPSSAHHSFAEWSRETATLTGTVTEYQWKNPHAWIMVDVPGRDGKVVNWGFETASPLVLKRFKWKNTSIKRGDKVIVTFHTNRHGGTTGNVVKVVLPDRSVLMTEDLISHPPGGAPGAPVGPPKP